MMQLEERVHYLFGASIETKIAAADTLSSGIAKASSRLVQCLLAEGKLLIAGNGGSSANCMHFASSLLNHFDVERPSLPVINLCSDASNISSFADENHFGQIFSRQIQALGQTQDVLILLTTSGQSDSMLQALQSATDKGLDTIVLSGRDGGLLAGHLGPEDIEIRVKADSAARIREMHLFILHCFCDLIDQSLFGQVLG